MDTNHKKEETQKRFSSGAGKKSCRTSSIKHNRDAVVLSPSHHMIGDHIFISVSYWVAFAVLLKMTVTEAEKCNHWLLKMTGTESEKCNHWGCYGEQGLNTYIFPGYLIFFRLVIFRAVHCFRKVIGVEILLPWSFTRIKTLLPAPRHLLRPTPTFLDHWPSAERYPFYGWSMFMHQHSVSIYTSQFTYF